MTYECNLFEICKEYCRPPTSANDINFKLPGVMVLFVHETIRVMNRCYYGATLQTNLKDSKYIYPTHGM